MKKHLITFCFALLSVVCIAQDRLVVQTLDEAEQTYAITQIGKVVPGEQALLLYSHNGLLLGSTPYAALRQIRFAGSATALNETQSGVTIYPNPTTESLTVNGLNSAQTIRIYNLTGNLLLSQQADDNATISVSPLPAGTYLLQVGAQIVKFIKQ